MNFISITDLSPPHLIIVEGKDAMTFLQGQLTCDVRQCQENGALRGAYCNIQGRIVGNFLLFLHQERYYLFFAEPIEMAFLTVLKKYAMFSKVTLSFAPSNLHVFGVWGLVEDSITLPGSPQRSLVFTEQSSLPGNQKSITEWALLDIDAGIANITPETQTLFLPHELQYEDAGVISLNKGCYLGQEIIARMHFKGKSKFSLYRVEADNVIAAKPGAELLHPESGRSVGRMVNVVGRVGLASLHHTDQSAIDIKLIDGTALPLKIAAAIQI